MSDFSGTGQQAAPARRGGGWGWLWMAAILLAILIAPVLGCGALGVGLMAAASASPSPSTALAPSVGVIRVEGPIVSGRLTGFSGTMAASDTIVELIERARDDRNIRAVVLRIDSPGGGVVASDEIHHALRQLGKPLVVSMGSMAASGGYYIAAPADVIYATPHTMTGSIGVISQFVTAEELLDELGIEVVVITAGEVKDFGSFTREMTAEERAYWQSMLDETHEGFIAVVAEGRGMDTEAVRALADGRVVNGQQALDLGLVDAIGYFDDAVARAAELGGIDGDPPVVELKPDVTLLDALYGFQSPAPGLNIDLLLRQIGQPQMEYRYLGR